MTAAKRCPTCDRTLPATAEHWHRRGGTRKGWQSSCKNCQRESCRGRYTADPQKWNLKRAAWRTRNPARDAAASSRYRNAHPEAVAAAKALRYAVERGSSNAEPFTRDYIYGRDGGNCHVCGNAVDRSRMSLDHLIPVSLGGPHVAENVRLAHLSCNARRGAGRLDTQLLLVG